MPDPAMPEPAVPNLDFLGLRGESEEFVRPPDFAIVERRAVRRRRRNRLATAMISSCTAVATVAAVVAMAANGSTAIHLDPDAKPTASQHDQGLVRQSRQQVIVHAVTGTGQGTYFAATDVCTLGLTATSCRLRIVRFGLQQRVLADNLLRRSTDVSLSAVHLTALSDRWLLLTATTSIGAAVTAKVATDDGRIGSLQRAEPSFSPGTGERLVQLAAEDMPCAVEPGTATLGCAEDARIVRRPNVVLGVPEQYGWWVTGLDRRTSDLAISVSHDRGVNWTTVGLSLPYSPDSLTLAVADADTAYMFVNTGSHLVELDTTDGGRTWNQATLDLTLPKELLESGALFGVPVGGVVRPDGTLMLWLTWEQRTSFYTSSDGGRTFTAMESLGGPVTQVPSGYLAITGSTVLYANDARAWTAVLDTADPWVTPT